MVLEEVSGRLAPPLPGGFLGTVLLRVQKLPWTMGVLTRQRAMESFKLSYMLLAFERC